MKALGGVAIQGLLAARGSEEGKGRFKIVRVHTGTVR